MTTVLEVIRQGEMGGCESHVLDLVQRLLATDVRPVVVAYSDGPIVDELRARGVRCHVVPTTSAFDPRVWRCLKRIAREEQADVIHVHGTHAASNMLYAAHRTAMPLVYTAHGWSFHQDQRRWVHWFWALSEKIICAMARRVICVSQTNFETGLHAFGLNLRKTDVIENGVNIDVFDPERGDLSGLRREFGFADTDVVVGFVARVTTQKDPLCFVQAVEQAHRKDARVKGLLVGEGDLLPVVRRYIVRHHLESVVRLSPFRGDVPRVLHAIDIYCLPSLWEGLSIVLLEALAMAKPAVVTPTDGTREIINDGENGLVVPFNSPSATAEAILQLVADPQLAHQMGAEGRVMILSRFDSRRVADHVCDIYAAMA